MRADLLAAIAASITLGACANVEYPRDWATQVTAADGCVVRNASIHYAFSAALHGRLVTPGTTS